MKKMKKIISICLAVTTICWLTSIGVFAPVVSAITIVEGDVVSPDATYTDDDGNTYYSYDVFIIKYVGDKKFKRLVLNPQVFESYGHLEWGNIKTATVAEVQAFTTSSLTRAIDDDKVYKLFPDGDIGTKQWVESLECFISQAYDWDSVYVINSVDRDNYTTGTSVCGGDDEVGDITISLASDTSAAATIPLNAANVTFAKFNITGTGTISQAVFKRSGAGDTNDFLNVYLYEGDNRIVNGRSISSSTSKVTFINLDITAPTTISLVADMSHNSGTAGNVSYFEIESASSLTSDATVGGTFPIKGNPMASAGAVGGSLEVAKPGSLSNPKVGQQNVPFSKFKLTTSAESIDVKRIRMVNGGDLASSKMTNLKLKVGGVEVATAAEVDADNYLTFVLDPAYEIPKGDNAIFDVYGDIAGSARVADTIKFYFETGNDIYGIGKTYGFGAATVNSSDTSLIITLDTSAEAHSLALEGGALTIAFNGPVASNLSTKAKDATYLDLTLTATQDIEVRKTRLVVCWDDDADGYDDLSGATFQNIDNDIEDIKMINKDTGVVLIGPVDADAAGWIAGDDSISCSGGVDGAYYDFTDTYNLSAGESLNVIVTADFASTLTTVAATDLVSFVLEGWANSALCGSSGDINVMRYTGTTTAVDDSDIVPSTDTIGKDMTLLSAELRVGLASLPGSQTFVKGTSGVSIVGFTIEATEGSDITITKFQPTAYVSDAGTTYAAGVDTVYARDLISAVYLYEGDTLIAGPTGFSGTDSKYVNFDNLTYVIPAGVTKTVTVKADLHNYTYGGGTDYVTFTVGAVTDIDSQDSEGNDLTEKDANGATFAVPNGTTSPTIAATIAAAGSLAVEAMDVPASTATYFGQQGAEFTKMTFSATNEAFHIDKLNVVVSATSGGEQAAGNRDEFTSLTLEYTNEAGDVLTQSQSFGATATISFTGFVDADRPYVPKDGDLTVTVKGNMNTWADGADSEQTVYVCLEGGSTESAEAADFEATGEGSGTKITGATLTGRARGQAMYIYRMFPEFAKVTDTSIEANDGKIHTNTEETVLRFTITAVGEPGAPDLLFDNVIDSANVTSGLIQFEIVASGASNDAPSYYLYDITTTETLVYETANAEADTEMENFGGGDQTDEAQNASALIRLATGTNVNDIRIPVGETKTYELRVNLSNFNDIATTTLAADYFSANLYLNEANVVQYVDRSKSDKLGTVNNVANIFKNKITGTVLYRE